MTDPHTHPVASSPDRPPVPDADRLRRYGEQVLDLYGDAIGRPIVDVVTPALLLDLPAARRNIDHMAAAMTGMPTDLRPHIKVHKNPELARMQISAGAIGLSVATVWEAAAMAAAGLDELFIVNTITHPAKIARVAQLAAGRRIHIAVDSAENAGVLADAARRAGTQLGVLIEVDTGMDRAGVDTAEAALAVARQINDLPQLSLDGVTGYEGHCALEPDPTRRAAKQQAAMDHLAAVADRLRADGLPTPIVSAGGTATWNLTAADARLTEIQAGTYAVMDNFHGAMVGGFEYALTVAATVISTPPGRVIVDAGNKSIGVGGGPSMIAPQLAAIRFDEEHGVFASRGTHPKLGDTVSLRPGYAPATVNLYDAFHVTDGDTVTDIWPVIPRGPGHAGFLDA